jgi:hypothetical protein
MPLPSIAAAGPEWPEEKAMHPVKPVKIIPKFLLLVSCAVKHPEFSNHLTYDDAFAAVDYSYYDTGSFIFTGLCRFHGFALPAAVFRPGPANLAPGTIWRAF